jgi:hypothetical protein
MKRLFIGGRLDGEWHETDKPTHVHPYTDPISAAAYLTADNDLPAYVPLKQEYYIAQPWQAESKRVYVMALEGLTPDEVMTKLMDGYRPTAVK